MNILMDKWLPVTQLDGELLSIAPWQITDGNVVDIAVVRLDFQGALHQFLIGVLQTLFAPEDEDEWQSYWHTPPSERQLRAIFEPISVAFELFSENQAPAFLQDFNMPDGERKAIALLLIEAPGGKTLKDNLDHFVKGATVGAVCEPCAAMALFTLQTNAPSGGVGHRVGLRGGGPLTTLLRPHNASTLWQKLWLNVLPQDELAGKVLSATANVFPWFAPTRVSDKKGASTLPDDVSLLQQYWGMPRRIRLEQTLEHGPCSLCGNPDEALVSSFRTKNYGVNYEGAWVHPLTPYRFDPKKEKPPLSLKGQQGGLGYRHWLSMNWFDGNNGDKAAKNVQYFYEERSEGLSAGEVGLWCFGYDMDNMKARCWYEHQMPVMAIDEGYQPQFISFVSLLLISAKDVVKELRSLVKAAWFNRPKDTKGDTTMIDASFWQATEAAFYVQLAIAAKQSNDTRTLPPEVAKVWCSLLRRQAITAFDYWVLEGNAEDLNMKRITKARRILNSKLKNLKSLKQLEQIANTLKEAV